MGAGAHRHRSTVHRGDGRTDQRPGAGRVAAGTGRRGYRARRSRFDSCRDHHAGHDLSIDRVHPAGKARRERRARIRRSGGLQRIRLRAVNGRSDDQERRGAQCAGGRRRNLFADPRLERSGNMRPVRRRRRRSGACPVRVAGHIVGASPRRRTLSRYPRCRAAANGKIEERRFCNDEGAVSKPAVKVLAEVAHEALANDLRRARSTG